jgi:hypothetical protein
MNFESENFVARGLSCNIERFIEQYLDEDLSDSQFREACLGVVDDIIGMHLELISIQKEVCNSMTNVFEKMKCYGRTRKNGT